MRAEAVLGHLLVLRLLSACGPESNVEHREQGGSSGASGVRTPDIPIDGVGGRASGIVVVDSTLEMGPRGWLDWYFTVENQTTEPFCDSSVAAKLYDVDGTLLAGSEILSYYIGDVPGFTAMFLGTPYRTWREDGIEFLRSCIPPGERGLGWGSILAESVDSTEADALALVARAARIEFTVGIGPASTDGYERADDVIQVEGAALEDEADGKVVRGRVVAGVDLGSWTFFAMLFEPNGAPTDVVRSFGSLTLAGAQSEFESELGGGTAARFEIALEAHLRY